MVKIDVMLDEMPKSCGDCWFRIEYLYGTTCIFSKLIPEIEEEIDEEFTNVECTCMPYDKRLKSCPLEEEEEEELDALLTPSERADVLNTINQALEQKSINLEVGGYSDMDGVLFDVYLMRR